MRFAIGSAFGGNWWMLGENEVGDPHPDPVALPARVDVDHADRGLHPVPFAERPEIVGEALAAGQRVEEGEMRRVHAVVLDLQPVAFPQRRGAGDQLVAGQVIGIEDRKSGLLVGRPHIGEDQTLRIRAPDRRRGQSRSFSVLSAGSPGVSRIVPSTSNSQP